MKDIWSSQDLKNEDELNKIKMSKKKYTPVIEGARTLSIKKKKNVTK
jgi:hypothetical protein